MAGERAVRWQDEDRIATRYRNGGSVSSTRGYLTFGARLGEDSAEMRDLRQNSPFADVPSEAERRRIWDGVR